MHYASKAFLTTETARWVAEEGLGLDVASGGELAIALRAGFPPERITVHGNNKSADELRLAVRSGVAHVVIDAMSEIEILDRIAGEEGVVQDVFIRVTVGVEAHTHEFIATAHEDQKFGFSLAGGAAMQAVRAVFDAPNIRLTGLHSHIGSQIFDIDGFELAARRVIGQALGQHCFRDELATAPLRVALPFLVSYGLTKAVADHDPDLVLSAGFMKLVGPADSRSCATLRLMPCTAADSGSRRAWNASAAAPTTWSSS